MDDFPQAKSDDSPGTKARHIALAKADQPSFEYERDTLEKFHISDNVVNNCSPHFHNQIEIIALQSGSPQPVRINETEEMLEPGDVAIADAFDIHAYTYAKTISTVLIIPGDFLRDFEQYKQKKRLATNFIRGNRTVYDACFPLLRQIVDADNLLLQKGLVNTLLGHIVDATGLTDSPSDLHGNIAFIRNILDYVEKHYNENITLDSIASHFSYSPSHFSRLFNNFFHYSITDYVNTVRMRQFFVLKALYPNKPLIYLIMESGFTSVPTFYRLFAKKFGVSPLKYFNMQ